MRRNTKNVVKTEVSFPLGLIAFLILFTLKLLGEIEMSWVWVLTSWLWVPLLIIGVVLALVLAFAGLLIALAAIIEFVKDR